MSKSANVILYSLATSGFRTKSAKVQISRLFEDVVSTYVLLVSYYGNFIRAELDLVDVTNPWFISNDW